MQYRRRAVNCSAIATRLRQSEAIGEKKFSPRFPQRNATILFS
jgi:hypothetical protein